LAKLILAALMSVWVAGAAIAQTPAAPGSTSTPEPSAPCVAAFHAQASELNTRLQAKQYSEASTLLDADLKVCLGNDPLTMAVRAMRAEVAVRLGDYQHALDLENSVTGISMVGSPGSNSPLTNTWGMQPKSTSWRSCS